MADDTRTWFAPNVVIGIGITLLGVVLMLDRVGVADALTWLRYWPLLLVAFGASIAAQALSGGPVRPCPPIVSPPLVILLVVAGLLASRVTERQAARGEGAGTVSVHAVMGENRRTFETEFRGGQMTSVMGQARLDLRQAAVAPGEEVSIDVFTVMGQTVVYVPQSWEVDIDTMPIAGGVKDERFGAASRESDADEDDEPAAAPVEPASAPDGTRPPRLVLRGFVMMGALRVRS
jgi:hypothetical protein